MWTTCTLGFYSAVEDEDDPTTIVVRTRCFDDAAQLRDWFDLERDLELSVRVKDGSDYPWRLFVPREDWASFCYAIAMGIDYPNFKGRIHELNEKRAQVYARVWQVMLAVEREDAPALQRWPAVVAAPQAELAYGGSIHDLTDEEWWHMQLAEDDELRAPVATKPRPRQRRRRGSRR